MKALMLTLIVLFAGALCAQNYNASRISSNYAGKTVAQTGVKLMANPNVPWWGDLYDGYADDYPIGFNFNFYGQTYSTVDICINGWVSFKQLSGTNPTTPIDAPFQGPPASPGHDGIIAPCWFDMWGYVMSSDYGMFAQTVGTAPNREFRVDFYTMTKWGGPGGTATFCLVLYETSNKIEVHYGNITLGTPFACGIENETGTNGVASADGWRLTAPTGTGYAFTLDPELDIERGSPIANNGSDNVGTFTAGAAQTLDYTAFNRGDATLNLVGPGGNLNILSQNNCSVSIVAAPPASIAASASAVFTLSVTAISAGAFDFAFEVISDDSDENPYTINVSGNANPAPTPEIDLTHNGTSVNSGGVIGAGELAVGEAAPLVLRIKNLGTGSLALTGAPQLQLMSMVNCSVSISAQPPATIAAASYADCTLTISPIGAGAFSFSVSVPSDDADENPYTVNVSGQGSTKLSGGGSGGGGGGGCTGSETGGAAMLLLLVMLAGFTARKRFQP